MKGFIEVTVVISTNSTIKVLNTSRILLLEPIGKDTCFILYDLVDSRQTYIINNSLEQIKQLIKEATE